MKDNILTQIEKAKLVGKGGACFSTAIKWKMVKEAEGDSKYVVCNASEGEPGIKKDGYIFENYAEKVVDGMRIAMDFLSAKKGYIYMNPAYYKKYALKLQNIIGDYPIEVFKKPHDAGYIGGEETSALNTIEGKRTEPRLRPPFPPTYGLWGQPTLVNNVETFYDVSLVAAGKFQNKRFYTINGDCLWTGVYELPEDWTMEKVLRETKNYPDFDFFVQDGGDASGKVLNSTQLKEPAGGGGAITIYSLTKHHPMDLMKKWINFFADESCGKCTPCREGVYRLKEILNSKEQNWKLFSDLLNNLSDTAFCGLGCAVPIAPRSYVANVLSKMPDNKIDLPAGSRKMICECFG